jgi:hypothetical protein
MTTFTVDNQELSMIRYGLMGEMKLINKQLKKALKTKNLDDVELYTKVLKANSALLQKLSF